MRQPHDLKSYVRKHPDNQMAWYLLGKEYERNGQTAKANYCFERSGGIYEAFEHSKAPAQVWMDYQQKLMEMEKQKRKQMLKRKTAAVLLWFFLLGLVPSAAAPAFINEMLTAQDFAQNTEQEIEPSESEEELVSEAYPDTSNAFTGIALLNDDTADEDIGEMMNELRSYPVSLIALGMEKENEYLLWGGDKKPVHQFVSRGDGTVKSTSLLPEWCKCTPEENAKLLQEANKWGEKEEEAVVLLSAIQSFKQHNGRFPEDIGEIARPFPDNMIGGVSPSMKKLYPEVLSYIKAGEQQMGALEEAGANPNHLSEEPLALLSFKDTLGAQPYMKEPLSVVVNKDTYRLTVLSGNVVIRNYEVGLGGERTPEGSFLITDKVVNPNGRADGEFGTRGMQLSDTNYAIHGTNEPDSIGLDESLGCIRMHQADVEELFALVPAGTEVTIKRMADTPSAVLVPDQAGERFQPKLVPGQTNPNKVYHWLN
ncbi:L,D-transpeptidase [Neobacillus mesonae]|nr:L,D-transpeptidase [Neobacillus mesonae]